MRASRGALRAAGTEGIFVDGENVLLCPPRCPEALAAAIESVLAESLLRAKLSAGALRLAQERFSWGGSVDRTIDTIWGPRGGNRKTNGRAERAGVLIQ